MNRFRNSLLLSVIVAVMLFLALQIWSTYAVVEATRNSENVQRKLAGLDDAKLSQAKTQEEIVALRVENDRKAVFISSLVANMNAALAVLVTLIGGALAIQQYLHLRRKESSDRSATELTELWKGITSQNPNVQAASIAGLQHFLDPEKQEFHTRVASALALVGRLQTDSDVVLKTYSRIVETAMRRIAPDVLRAVSWQGIRIRKANLSGLTLANFDFRDADMQDSDFTRCDLAGARLDAANLNWSHFDSADLSNAVLRYADLAGADLQRAKLVGANLRHAKVLGCNLKRADLTNASFRLDSLDWSLIQNWRTATLNDELRNRLIETYGPDVRGTRILMLVWEYPPFISGGGWTAAYHLLKTLRLKGADVTILIPWSETSISRDLLGYEFDLLSAGIEHVGGAYGQYSGYSAYAGSEAHQQSGVSLGKLATEFATRAADLISEQSLHFDAIHAHDWVTFAAAKRIAAHCAVPWVAHFHSTEFDRREAPSAPIKGVERDACQSANFIVAVGPDLRNTLIKGYAVPESTVEVVPNCFSDSQAIDRIGDFHAQRAVFIGRLSSQKGPDHFVRFAAELRKLRPQTRFDMYGTGDMLRRVATLIDQLWDDQPAIPLDVFKKRDVLYPAIEPLDIDSETGEWFLRGPVVYPDTYSVAEFIRKNISAVRPVQCAEPYTHLVTVKTDISGDGYYLIQTSYAPSYTQLPNLFVRMHPALPWRERRLAFEGASLIVVPSRSEPFGLVILEAMQFGVPVFYPSKSGVASVISSGSQFDPEDYIGMASMASELLGNITRWEEVVERQINDISVYRNSAYAGKLQEIWGNMCKPTTHSETAR